MENKITRIDIDEDGDITFYFEGSEQPFSCFEFTPASLTRRHLEEIDSAIHNYNYEVELRQTPHHD